MSKGPDNIVNRCTKQANKKGSFRRWLQIYHIYIVEDVARELLTMTPDDPYYLDR